MKFTRTTFLIAALIIFANDNSSLSQQGRTCENSECWTNATRPTTGLAPGRCGMNISTNMWECYNPLAGEAPFDAAKQSIPGSDVLGNLIPWSTSGGIVYGPMLVNPSLPGGPYGSNAFTVLDGTIGLWNARLYGWSHAATGICLLTGFAPPANLNDSQGSCIVAGGYGDRAGIPPGSGSASYNSRDTVTIGAANYSPPALYPVNAAGCTAGGGPAGPCASNYFAGSYTATTYTPTTPINGGIFLRVGMTIDTNDATPFSGIISSFTLNGAKQITSITVPAFYLMNAACLANQANCTSGIPTGGAALSRQQKIFGTNFAVTRNTQSEVPQAIGIEMDCNNATGIADTGDTMAVPPTTAYDGCYDAVNLGNARASFGYIARGLFVTGYKSEADTTTAAFRVSPFSTRTAAVGYLVDQDGGGTVTAGFVHRMTAVNAAYRIQDPGGDIFADLYRNEWRLGRQKTTPTAFTMNFWSAAAGNNDGTNPDARFAFTGGAGNLGGTLTITANSIVTNTINSGIGLQLNNATLTAVGPTSNQALTLTSRGASNINLTTNTGTNTQAVVVHTEAPLERISLTGAVSGGSPTISTLTTDSLTPSLKLNALGNIILGAGSVLGTAVTAGLPAIPTMTGTPTGTVGTAGSAVMVIDTTNKQLCYSIGGGVWECSKTFTP